MLEVKEKKENKPVYSLRLPAWAIAYIKKNKVDVNKIIITAIEKEFTKKARKR